MYVCMYVCMYIYVYIHIYMKCNRRSGACTARSRACATVLNGVEVPEPFKPGSVYAVQTVLYAIQTRFYAISRTNFIGILLF